MNSDADKWRAVVEFCEGNDPALLLALGKATLHGIDRIKNMEKFTPVMDYTTHFPIEDGSEWHITIRRYT